MEDVEVGAAQPCSRDSDACLARPGLGGRHLDHGQLGRIRGQPARRAHHETGPPMSSGSQRTVADGTYRGRAAWLAPMGVMSPPVSTS